MKRNTVGKALVAAVITSVVLAGCGSDDNIGATTGTSKGSVKCGGKDELTGEGSTAQQNAIALFNRAWGRLCAGNNVSYDATGSAAGREQFVAGHVDFAGSDSPLRSDQINPAAKRCHGHPVWHLPLVFGPVAVAYHLDGVNPLIVNADVLARIFSGAITSWRDPMIAALNPGVALPDIEITPIYRSDPSGTTDNFQKYLVAAAPQTWTKGTGTDFQGGVGDGAQTSGGVAQAVQSTPGAIGYVEKSFADQARIPYAQIDTGSGAVALTDHTAATAIEDAKFIGSGNDLKLDLQSLYSTREPGAYPLLLAIYEIVCSRGYDVATSGAVKSFLNVATHDGQSGLSSAGYVPLPDKFKTRLVAAINAID